MSVILSNVSENLQGTGYQLSAVYPSSTGNTSAVSQCFTTPNNGQTYALTQAVFYLYTGAGSPGTLNAVLYAMTGTYGTNGKPTGSALATSGNVSGTGLGGSYGLVTFTFSGAQQYVMSANTNYCIVVQATSGTFDGSDYVEVGADNSGVLTGYGNVATYLNSAWSTSSSIMTIFYVYGQSTASVPSLCGSGGVIASLPTTDYSSGESLGAVMPGAGSLKSGFSQAFTAPIFTAYLTQVQFYLYYGFSKPVGLANAKLYNATGSVGSYYPTGAPLAISAPYQISNLTGSYQLITFTFPTPYELTASARTVLLARLPVDQRLILHMASHAA